MTHEEMEAFGQDLALTVRANGQNLADLARATGSGSSASLITMLFDHAAKVIELRVLKRIIESRSAKSPEGGAHG